jgi:hypothetical protein
MMRRVVLVGTLLKRKRTLKYAGIASFTALSTIHDILPSHSTLYTRILCS